MKANIKVTLLLGITSILFSCKKQLANDDIKILLNSNDKTEIIKGCSLLKNEDDTVFVKYLFNNINDSRVSHNSEFYGISVYQSKIFALQRISGIKPPNKITYKFDSVNTAFYRKWAIEHKLINN